MNRRVSMFLIGMLIGSGAWLFVSNNHESFYVHEHTPWQIEVRHDGKKCFAFIMDRETQVHHYVLNCRDTTLITEKQ